MSTGKRASSAKDRTFVASHTTTRNSNLAFSFNTHGVDDDQRDGGVALDLAIGQVQSVVKGDLKPATEMLMSQAVALDALFTHMAKRAGNNMGEYPEAAETYMRLALKAQANCRTTLEAVAKIARGGEQIVKHVHIDNRGGQAVVAETVQTGGQNGGINGQPHATTTTVVTSSSAALPSPDPLGLGVPLAFDAEREVSHARRQEPGSAEGE